MRVTLVHNPEAGLGSHLSDDLLVRLRDAGHDASYTSTEAASLSRMLATFPDIVLAAGGDGTIGAVARLMATQAPSVPLAILPTGTANNLARALGVDAAVEDIVDGLESTGRRTLDISTARAPWGTARFVESAGVGAFGAMLRDAQINPAPSLASGQRLPNARGDRLRRMVDATSPRLVHVEAGGEDLTGEYLFVLALNTSHVGPGLALAASADAGDGHLDLLLVSEDDRHALGDFFNGIAGGADPDLALPTRRVRHARLEWAGDGHLDDRLWPEGPVQALEGDDGMVDLVAAETSIPVVVPAAARDAPGRTERATRPATP